MPEYNVHPAFMPARPIQLVSGVVMTFTTPSLWKRSHRAVHATATGCICNGQIDDGGICRCGFDHGLGAYVGDGKPLSSAVPTVDTSLVA